MKKLNLAIIGQGRSGRDIHGNYYLSQSNQFYNVKYVVEEDELRRKRSEERYPGCTAIADYRDLFDLDVDLVVNATYSELHYPITKDLLLHGKNVLVEKPFGRTRYECDELIKIANEKGAVLAVFQQSFLAPFYTFAYDLVHSDKLGEIKQIEIRYNGLSRRWDWQTLQKRCAGSAYNTGPHPIGIALGLIDFDPYAKVIYSKLDTVLTSGDSDDYAKIIIAAPGKPLVDVEMSPMDAYPGATVKIQGSRGTFKCSTTEYSMTYICEGENPERPVQETFMQNENGDPAYCFEKLITHVESDKFGGTAFDIGTSEFYRQLYYKITDGTPMTVTPEMAAQIISVIETAHAQNTLPLKY